MLAFIRDRNTSVGNISQLDYVKLGADGSRLSSYSQLTMVRNFQIREHWNRTRKAISVHMCFTVSIRCIQSQRGTNHEFIRRILQKGSSFIICPKQNINLYVTYHSYSREKYRDNLHLDMFGFIYGYDVLESLGLNRIMSNQILLKPSLLIR